MNSANRLYTSPIRDRQARETRRAMTAAAADLFVSRGYAATSVSAIAQRAGVSAQTVYNAFGTKRDLLKATYDVTLAGDDEPVPLAERPDVKRLYELTDAAGFLHGYADLGRELLTRVGALQIQIAAGAAAGEPDLAEHQRVTDEERLTGTMFVARRVEALGALAGGLSLEQARDRIWALNSAGLWHLLTSTRGWTGDDYATWIGDQMCAAVLA